MILLLTGLTACAYAPVTNVQDRDGGSSGSAEPPPTPDAGGATAELLSQSRVSQAAGQYPQAAADIERALRIEPRNAYLWLELGKIRLATGDRQQAIALAQKALSMAGEDGRARREAQDLIDFASVYDPRPIK
jgi:tetratricopeptide (TPR) repeat protein